MTKAFFKQAPAQIILLLFITIFAYINIFYNGFVFDDLSFILGWRESIQGNVTAILQGVTPAGQGGIYRPWRGLFYILTYHFFSNNLFYYHLQSLILILSTTVLVYLISRIIFRKNWPAFITAVLFGLHPIHVEAITFMTASFDSIGLLFFFLSFYFYLKSKTGDTRKKFDFYLLSVVSAVVAFFTYEMTLVLMPMFILYDLCFEKEEFAFNIRKIIKQSIRYVPYIVLCLIYIFIRVILQQITGRGEQYLANSFYLTQLVTSRIITEYLQLLLFPVNLAVNHTILPGIFSAFWAEDNNQIVAALTIFKSEILLSVIGILITLATTVISYKRVPILTFVIGWFFIGISPVMNFIPPGTLMGERYLFISSFSFCLLIAYVFDKLYQVRIASLPKYTRGAYQPLLISILILLSLFYLGSTIKRNSEWKNEIALWQHDVKVSPNSGFNHQVLANAYDQKGFYQLALMEAQQTVLFAPQKAASWSLLGRIYFNLNRDKEAELAFRKGLAIEPNYLYLYHHLGSTLEKQGKIDEALSVYQLGIKNSNGFDTFSYVSQGDIYKKRGQIEKAINSYQKATEANPYFAVPHWLLADLYKQTGKEDMATKEIQKAIVLERL